MGLTLAKLFRYVWGKRAVRIVMVGLDAAGKTSILFKMKLGETVMAAPTIGFNVEEVEVENVKFTVWDVGGQKKIRNLWNHYYENVQAVIFVVDSADVHRLSCEAGDCEDCARCELQAMLRSEMLQNVTLLVFANKQDLPNALPPEQVSQRLGLQDLTNRKWYIQGCCALDGRGLHDGFQWLTKNAATAPSAPQQ